MKYLAYVPTLCIQASTQVRRHKKLLKPIFDWLLSRHESHHWHTTIRHNHMIEGWIGFVGGGGRWQNRGARWAFWLTPIIEKYCKFQTHFFSLTIFYLTAETLSSLNSKFNFKSVFMRVLKVTKQQLWKLCTLKMHAA